MTDYPIVAEGAYNKRMTDTQDVGCKWVEIKDALIQGLLPTSISSTTSISSMCQYFIETKCDFRSIKECSYQMFCSGHIQNTEVKDNVTAKKSLCKTRCLLSMRTDWQYKVMIILSHQGDILQVNC